MLGPSGSLRVVSPLGADSAVWDALPSLSPGLFFFLNNGLSDGPVRHHARPGGGCACPDCGWLLVLLPSAACPWIRYVSGGNTSEWLAACRRSFRLVSCLISLYMAAVPAADLSRGSMYFLFRLHPLQCALYIGEPSWSLATSQLSSLLFFISTSVAPLAFRSSSIVLSIWSRLSFHANASLARSSDSCVVYFGWSGIWSSLCVKIMYASSARSSLRAGHGSQPCEQNSVAASRLPLLCDSVEDNLPYLAPCRKNLSTI